MERDPTTPRIEISTIVAAANRKGLVQLQWGSMSGQLTPEETIEHALRLLGAAEAARGDELFFRLLTERLGADTNMAGKLLLELRTLREQREAAGKPS